MPVAALTWVFNEFLTQGRFLLQEDGWRAEMQRRGLLQALIGSLCLSVRLGVISGGETDSGTDAFAESLPGLGGELGSTVTDNVYQESMKAIDMFHKQLRHLLGRREVRESHEVHNLGETIYHCEDNSVAH